MKKVLIGCGLIFGLGILAAGILGFLGYRKIRSMKAHIAALGEEQQSLNRDFPWQGGDHPPRPDEARLKEYLAVRRSALVPFRKMTAEMDRLEKNNRAGGKTDIWDVINAGTTAYSAMIEVMEIYARELRAKRMSSSEFRALTRVIYPAPGEPDVGSGPPHQSPELAAQQQRLDDLNRRLNDPALTAAERATMTAQRDAAEIQLKATQNAGPAVNEAAPDPLQGEIDALRDFRFDEMIVKGKTRFTPASGARPLTGPAGKVGGDSRD